MASTSRSHSDFRTRNTCWSQALKTPPFSTTSTVSLPTQEKKEWNGTGHTHTEQHTPAMMQKHIDRYVKHAFRAPCAKLQRITCESTGHQHPHQGTSLHWTRTHTQRKAAANTNTATYSPTSPLGGSTLSSRVTGEPLNYVSRSHYYSSPTRSGALESQQQIQLTGS
jgi:hypothetical protein